MSYKALLSCRNFSRPEVYLLLLQTSFEALNCNKVDEWLNNNLKDAENSCITAWLKLIIRQY